ncbi:MAG: glycosyltransferase family 39 protein [Acidobacteriota bacterium]|jgi:hypothetical protein
MRSDPTPPRPDRTGLAVLAGSLVYLHLFVLRGMGWIDEGFALNAARRIAGGEVLYRDFFAPYGPGRHYLLGWAFDLLGTRLLVARSLWILLLALTAVALYRVGRRLMPRNWAAAAAVCFVLFPPQAFKAYTPLAYAGIALLSLRAIERPVQGRWLAAGAGVGLAGLFRFDLWGTGTVILAVAWLLGRDEAGRRRPAGLRAAAAGMLLTAAPPLAAYGATGFLPDLVRYEAMQKAQLARFFALPLPSPLRAWAEGNGLAAVAAGTFDAIAAWVPALLAAVALWRATVRRRAPAARDAALLLVGVACAAGQVVYFSRPDFDHLLHVTPLAFVLLLYFLRQARLRAGDASVWWGVVAAGGLFVALFAASAILRHPLEGFSIGRLRVATERVDGGAREVFWDTPYRAGVFRGVSRLVASLPDGPQRDEIAFLPFGGIWYFLLDLRNPIPQEPLSTYSGGDGRWADEERDVIRELEDAGVRFVFLERSDPRYAILPPFGSIHPVLARYLEATFRDTGDRIGEWSLLVRRDRAAP